MYGYVSVVLIFVMGFFGLLLLLFDDVVLVLEFVCERVLVSEKFCLFLMEVFVLLFLILMFGEDMARRVTL